MLPLLARVQHYLTETIGAPASQCQAWAGKSALPYFLSDSFDFWKLDILGLSVVLAIDRNPRQSSVGGIRAKLDQVRAIAGQPVVYVVGELASYERKRLIEQKVPFIVPGNQLYLPELAIDLREYFRQRAGPTDTPLSPSAQALLICALLRPRADSHWRPTDAVAILGYTPMTLSRAMRELTATQLAHTHKTGRSQSLVLAYSPRETWERAGPLLRSPVQRTAWAFPPRTQLTAPLAGLSALARHSMLAEPTQTVHAVSRAAWQAQEPKLDELPEPLPGTHEWQLWNYNPALQPDRDTVDPLSLILSLRDNTDERVQSALDDLQEQLPW